ncbi:MAG: acyl-CoA dehydrogenase family protein, partial [bacterium]|nr:acyl-CoA dehydrogenase family protein [bacterium]
MDNRLSEEQNQLREAASRFMDEECTMEFVRKMEESELGFDRALWKKMAELGWLGIDLPDEDGGLGLGTVDLTILMKELGRHLCPTPFIPTAVIAGSAIAGCGSEDQRRTLIPQIVDGEIIIAFACQEFSRSGDPGEIKLAARP